MLGNFPLALTTCRSSGGPQPRTPPMHIAETIPIRQGVLNHYYISPRRERVGRLRGRRARS